MKLKKFALLFSLALFSSFIYLKLHASAEENSAPVTADDLRAAGFSNIAPEMSPSGRFSGPAYYFQVGDWVDDPRSEAPDIVMVSKHTSPSPLTDQSLYAYASSSQAFEISGGQGKEGSLADGRTAINFIKGNDYFVIIGPDAQKIENLARELADKN